MDLVTEKQFTIPEAAEQTRMSKAWWRQAVWQRKVRFLKIGRRIFIPESTIRELLTKGVVEPVAKSR